jgi:hypothetical protein
VAPVRPRYTAFQNLFYPNQQPLLAPGGGFLRPAVPSAVRWLVVWARAAGPWCPGSWRPGR